MKLIRNAVPLGNTLGMAAGIRRTLLTGVAVVRTISTEQAFQICSAFCNFPESHGMRVMTIGLAAEADIQAMAWGDRSKAPVDKGNTAGTSPGESIERLWGKEWWTATPLPER